MVVDGPIYEFLFPDVVLVGHGGGSFMSGGGKKVGGTAVGSCGQRHEA